ncbi:10593_t:CDS:2, partial [Racocetra persica]
KVADRDNINILNVDKSKEKDVMVSLVEKDKIKDETMLLIEASLDVVMKMNKLIKGLVETLRKWKKLNSAEEFIVNNDSGEAADVRANKPE